MVRVLRDEPRLSRGGVLRDGLVERIVPRDLDRDLEPAAPQRGRERLEPPAVAELQLLARAGVRDPHGRDAARVDVRVVVARELECGAGLPREPRGALEHRLLVVGQRIDDDEDGSCGTRLGCGHRCRSSRLPARVAEPSPL